MNELFSTYPASTHTGSLLRLEGYSHGKELHQREDLPGEEVGGASRRDHVMSCDTIRDRLMGICPLITRTSLVVH